MNRRTVAIAENEVCTNCGVLNPESIEMKVIVKNSTLETVLGLNKGNKVVVWIKRFICGDNKELIVTANLCQSCVSLGFRSFNKNK